MNQKLKDLKDKYEEDLLELDQKYMKLFSENREQIRQIKQRLNRPEQKTERVGEIIIRELK